MKNIVGRNKCTRNMIVFVNFLFGKSSGRKSLPSHNAKVNEQKDDSRYALNTCMYDCHYMSWHQSEDMIRNIPSSTRKYQVHGSSI